MNFINKLPVYYQDYRISEKKIYISQFEKEDIFILEKVSIYTPSTQSINTSSSIFYKAVSKLV